MNVLRWLCGLACVSPLMSADWPQFRGAQASGVESGAEPAPVRWDASRGEGIRWRTPIPGLAHASPIVWKDRAYVVTAVRPGEAELKVGLYGDVESINDSESHQWRLLSLDLATGRVVWDKLAWEGIPRLKRHPKSTHCNPTPATDGRVLVATLGAEGLFGFDLEGNRLWRVDLGQLDSGYFEEPTAQWGFASSPVLHEGKVVVQCDVQTNSFLALFDASNGSQLWRTPRRDVPTWSTPTVVAVGTATRILVNGWHHIGGYDFPTGQEVWRLDGGGDIPVPTPVVGHGLAYFTSAHGGARPMRAIRLDAVGDITPSEIGATNASIVWAHARQGNYMQTPIVVRDHLYGCLDNGILTCFDARTGAIRYSERLGNSAEGFTASPVSDGRHLYFASEPGNVYVVPADGRVSVVATNRFDETCMASPAIHDGRLLFRLRGHLVAVGAAKPGEPR